jgi:hypothetical protein
MRLRGAAPGCEEAHDYLFRSEQAGVTSLDHLGQYVDGTPGSVQVCSLTIIY